MHSLWKRLPLYGEATSKVGIFIRSPCDVANIDCFSHSNLCNRLKVQLPPSGARKEESSRNAFRIEKICEHLSVQDIFLQLSCSMTNSQAR